MAPLSATAMHCERIVKFPRQRILGMFLAFLLASGPLLGQPLGRPGLRGKSDTLLGSPALKIPAEEQNEATGIVRGTISDATGVMVAGARLILTHDDHSPARDTLSAEDGSFVFIEVKPGPFSLQIELAGFAPKQISGTVHPGETLVLPPITLTIQAASTQVRVELTEEEIAQEQIRDQEKQRVIGFIPNFYVSYVPDAAPLRPKQKFRLAYRTSLDPVTFLFAGLQAGVEQATDQYTGYGQGASGYAKRFGAAYADFAIGTFVSNAVFPSVFKQDPRYFYKGTGSAGSRARYAVKSSVFCRGDDRQWQFCYSVIVGSLVAGAISNAYYPDSDRGVGLVFKNAALGIAATAGVNLLQEFLLKKISKGVPDNSNTGSNGSP